MAINEEWGSYPYFDDRRPHERFGYGHPYERYYQLEGYPYERQRFEQRGDLRGGEHTWRGGILAWLGAGIRAGAGWFGDRLQEWGTRFGGRLSGGTAEIGRAVRGRGEQMASALEDQDERAAATLGASRNRPARYRRPDERILDDVWHRISVAAIDPRDVEVEVHNGVVTLSGRVSTRFEKRIIEDIADGVFGVQEVHNHLRLARAANEARPGAGVEPLQGNAGARSEQNSIGQPERH
jgi:HSP20 family molecular chaperone IbpA